MRRREFLLSSSVAAFASPLPAQAVSSKPQIPDLEARLPKLMEEAKVPGLSLVIIEDAKVRWRRGFGAKDSVSRRPIHNTTMFEAASMSKPVFAYAVMQLCERGVLDLDTPLTRYTSERFLEGDPRLDLITARHVLCHRSGFQNWRSEKEPLSIHFTPGEGFLYSGEGYNYLQTVVTHLTGQPFEAYMKSNVFGPFGMTSSGYLWNDEFAQRMARPHDKDGKPMDNKKSTPADAARYGSAGALLTTPTDYAKFMIEVIDPKPSDAFRVKKTTLEEMLRPQVKSGQGAWALGWKIAYTDKGDIINHGGDNAGFHCWALASVKRKSGLVIMTNGDGGEKLLVDLLTGDLLNRFL